MNAQPQGEQSYSLVLPLLAQTLACREGSEVCNFLASLQPPRTHCLCSTRSGEAPVSCTW